MAYIINKTNGDQLTVVADGTIDTTLDVKLIGKNYAGFGEIQNENLVFMLEHFANSTAPTKPISGQVWFDSGTKKLKFYDSTKWRTTGGAEIGPDAPTGLTVGDFWFDTTNKQLNAWDGAAFVLVGPQAAGTGTTEMRSRSVKATTGTGGATHPIIEAVINEDTVFIINNSDTEFDLDPGTNAITGFTKIHRGVTLCFTDDDSSGNIGQTTDDHRFWGTATNSDRLGGFTADSFVQAGVGAAFTSLVNFSDFGYSVGNPGTSLRVYLDPANDNDPTIHNAYNDKPIVFKTTKLSVTKTPMILSGSDILAGESTISNLGGTANQFATIYANYLTGTAAKSDTLSLNSVYVAASTASSANTIAARDSSSNITANLFIGTATSAEYADLAEKYLADAVYEPGTVVTVGGEQEVTACNWGDRAIGAVSTNPAFMMNKDLEGGTYIALKGRVPVKVKGPVVKGERLTAGPSGCAAVNEDGETFAIALESNDDASVKLVECLVL